MKQLTKWLVPPFLRRFDRYLLENHPSVWSTGGHFVLFYGILVAVVLFVAGFCYPINPMSLTVHPVYLLSIENESYYSFCIPIMALIVSFWVFKIRFLDFEITNIFPRFLVFFVCLFVLMSLNLTSFRLGMIYRMAYYHINQKDIDFIKDNNFQLYGFVIDSSTTEFDEGIFLQGEKTFNDIYKLENFESRYIFTKDTSITLDVFTSFIIQEYKSFKDERYVASQAFEEYYVSENTSGSVKNFYLSYRLPENQDYDIELNNEESVH